MFTNLFCNHCANFFSQISAIKERVKKITAFEQEITKYKDDGKDAYKEVKVYQSFLSDL